MRTEMFDALLRRKNAQLAEALVESNDLLVPFDNIKVFVASHNTSCVML